MTSAAGSLRIGDVGEEAQTLSPLFHVRAMAVPNEVQHPAHHARNGHFQRLRLHQSAPKLLDERQKLIDVIPLPCETSFVRRSAVSTRETGGAQGGPPLPVTLRR
eukprot:scaffold2968_cov321-Pinguiococcus_pyrenoidosus.AAC.12